MERRLPILLAIHDYNGDWQFHWGGPVTQDDCQVVCLEEVFLIDSTIGEVADLPRGSQAERDAVGKPWTRSTLPVEEAEG